MFTLSQKAWKFNAWSHILSCSYGNLKPSKIHRHKVFKIKMMTTFCQNHENVLIIYKLNIHNG